jgi:hypothetical protein
MKVQPTTRSLNGVSHGTSVPPAAHPQSDDQAKNWRQSKWLVILELAVVVLIFIADARHFIPVSKTPFLLLLGCISLWGRRVGWKGVGLARYRNWKTTVALGAGIGILLEAFELFVSQPLLVKWLGKQPDLSVFRSLNGNLKLTLTYIVLSWFLAGFGEEMVYRGYLMNRVADLLNRTRAAWAISLIVVHAGFGLAHAYQGLTGVIDEGFMGLLLGIVYLRANRNLSVPIVAHGLQDSIDLVLMFLGKYPGM